MAITLEYLARARIKDKPGAAVPGLGTDTEIEFAGLDTAATLTAISTPAVTKYAIITKALSSGAASIDLTSIAATLNAWAGNVDFSGLKLQVLRVLAPLGNTGNITITKGATNGYGIGSGHTSFTEVLPPGGEVLKKFNNNNAVVDSTHKTLDITGTGTESVTIELVFG